MNMNQVKTAVIGTGKVSHNHAKALQALPESVLTAVCGRSPEKTAEFAAQYQITPYSDVTEMIAAGKFSSPFPHKFIISTQAWLILFLTYINHDHLVRSK